MRKRIDRLVLIACGLCAASVCAILLGLVAMICGRGAPALSWTFLTGEIRQVGAQGGIFYNLVGTAILIASALAVAAPIATALALLERVWLRNARSRKALALFLYTLNGLPSIVLGIFGFIVFVKWLGWGKSWLTGGVLLGAMILPTVSVALIDRIKAIPANYLESAASLGLRPSQVIWSVILPQSWSGLLTGSLLGLSRAAGETAPIMFTATIFAGATLPRGIADSPVLSLPYHIFILAQDSFDPAVSSKLWGSALVLLALVLAFSVIALPSRLRIHEESNV